MKDSKRWRLGRFTGEIASGPAFALNITSLGGAWVQVAPIFFRLFITLPWRIADRLGNDRSWGFIFTRDGLHLNWGDHSKVWWWPWSWSHVRHSLLWPDGTVYARQFDHYEAPDVIKEQFRYRYTLESGEVQYRTATVYGEEREWRWRCAAWLPWPRKTRRTIDVQFSDEVGERTGSWKGGTLGCGWEWRANETQQEALRRMERDRKFR